MAPVEVGHIIHSCHCTEISIDEYRRVARLKPRDDRVEKFLLKKEELKALCDERIKKWPNTLKNLRENRIKNIKRRIEKEEEEKRKQDVIDAAFRAQKRREQLEKSNLQLLKPHIKELHFTALMEQVLKEREHQIAYKQKMEIAWRQKGQWWHELLMRDCVKGKIEDDHQEQLCREKCMDIQRDQAKQLAQRRMVLHKLIDEKKAAGEHFKNQAAEDLTATEMVASLKEERQIKMNKDFLDFNVKLQESRQREKERQKQLDVQISEYVANKERMDNAIKSQQDGIQDEKNRIRDRQIENLARQLQDARLDSETRLAVAENEARITEDMREQIFAAKRKQDWEACDRSRQQQIHMKKDYDDMKMEDAKYKAEQVWQRVLEVQEMDEAEFKATRQKNKILADDQMKLVEERKVVVKKERDYEIDEFKMNWKKMAEDEEYIKDIKIQ